MGITQIKPDVYEKLIPVLDLRRDVFIKIKEKLYKMIWINGVQRINKFDISQIFDIPVKQASLIELVFNSKIKRSKQQPDQVKINESHIPALSESRISQVTSIHKPAAKIGPAQNKLTSLAYQSIDSTELLMWMILCSEHNSIEEKWKEWLGIINANMFSYMTYSEIKLAFKYCYSIIKCLTDISKSSSEIENWIYDNCIFNSDEYYKDKQVDMTLIVNKISRHPNFIELVDIFTQRNEDQTEPREEQKVGTKASDQKIKSSSKIDKQIGEISDTKIASKVSSGFKNAINNNSFKYQDEEIESIQEIQSENSFRRNSVSPNSKSNNLAQKAANDQAKLVGGVIIRNRREEDDQASKQKQIRFESAQIHLEILKFKLEKKIYFKCESYIKYMMKYISSVKSKVMDSYFVAAIPSIIDSFIFEEDLRSRNVSLISESLMKVIRKIPKTPRIEEEDGAEKPK